MRPDINREFHLARAREEGGRAEQATHPAAKAAHVRLAKLHACLAKRPDFVFLEKASRAGQSPSYWASVDLRSASRDAEDMIEAGQGQSGAGEPASLTRPRARRRDTRQAVAAILNNTYTPPADDGVSVSDEAAGDQ